MVGLAVMFGLALLLTILTFRTMESFVIWLNIFTGFVVWAGLVDIWVLMLTLIVLTIIIANSILKKRQI